MAANIRSVRNGDISTAVDAASRDDLRLGDEITLTSLDVASTYLWELRFAPEDRDGNPSSAVFLPPEGSTSSTARFLVDHEGPYLVRLLVDVGLPTESEQYVRLRALTEFGQLSYVAAGERRDAGGTIPVDVSIEGWANDQNQNLAKLTEFVSTASASGRILYVDANRGTDNTETPDNPAIAKGYGNFSSINEATQAALADPIPPSFQNPYIVAVRPGHYKEDLQVAPFVYIVATELIERGPDAFQGIGRTHLVQTTDGDLTTHRIVTVNPDDIAVVIGLTLESTDPDIITTGATEVSGPGKVLLSNCSLIQSGDFYRNGPAVRFDGGGDYVIQNSDIVNTNPDTEGAKACVVRGEGTRFRAIECYFEGKSGLHLNPQLADNLTVFIDNCELRSTGNHPKGYAICTIASFTHIRHTRFIAENIMYAFQVNPNGLTKAGDLVVRAEFCDLDDIYYDTTGVGNPELQLGSCSYNTLQVVPNVSALATGGIQAITKGETVQYDPSSTSLTATNIQQAIDQLAVGGGGSLPPFTGIQYAFLMEDPGGVPIFQPAVEEMIRPGFNVSLNGGGTFEVNDVVNNPNFGLAFTRGIDWTANVLSATLTDGINPLQVLSIPPPAAYVMPFSYSPGVFTSGANNFSVGFTLDASDVFTSDTGTAALRWQPRTFFFASSTDPVGATPTDWYADLISKAGSGGASQLDNNRNRTFTVTAGAGEHIYYVYPDSYGAATFTVGGFSGGFTLINTVSVENPFGNVQDYRVYKSNNPNLGTTTVVVS